MGSLNSHFSGNAAQKGNVATVSQQQKNLGPWLRGRAQGLAELHPTPKAVLWEGEEGRGDNG